jgi:hypothetical protein
MFGTQMKTKHAFRKPRHGTGRGKKQESPKGPIHRDYRSGKSRSQHAKNEETDPAKVLRHHQPTQEKSLASDDYTFQQP